MLAAVPSIEGANLVNHAPLDLRTVSDIIPGNTVEDPSRERLR